MGSLTANMHNHIALQAEGSSIYLTVKESYRKCVPNRQQIENLSSGTHNESPSCNHERKRNRRTKNITHSYQGRSHIYHNAGPRWDRRAPRAHADSPACYTYEPATPIAQQFTLLGTSRPYPRFKHNKIIHRTRASAQQ